MSKIKEGEKMKRIDWDLLARILMFIYASLLAVVLVQFAKLISKYSYILAGIYGFVILVTWQFVGLINEVFDD